MKEHPCQSPELSAEDYEALKAEYNLPNNRVTYACDPDLNTQCKKTSCYINGGVCSATKHLEFAKQPVEKAFLTIPMSQEDFDSLKRVESKPNKVHHHPKRKGGKK